MTQLNFFIVTKRIDPDEPKGGIRTEMPVGSNELRALNALEQQLDTFEARGFQVFRLQRPLTYQIYMADHLGVPATVDVWLEARQQEVVH